MGNKKITIGTRGSQLAVYQANRVKAEICKLFPEIIVDIQIIKTKGDIILDVPLAKIGDKGLFTKEIEDALLDSSIDLAVHSLKDMPTQLPKLLEIGAVLKRGEVCDALVTLDKRKLNELNNKDIIATSSLRRRAALLNINPEFSLIDIRGNVNTRLKKMESGHCSAMVMAAAGLQRLGLESYISEIIDPYTLMPAVSQGAIAIEIRENDDFIKSICASINHSLTWIAVQAERSFMHHLMGGCQVPIGCYSKFSENEIHIMGFVASTDGKILLKNEVKMDLSNPENSGIQLAKLLLDAGAEKILASIRN